MKKQIERSKIKTFNILIFGFMLVFSSYLFFILIQVRTTLIEVDGTNIIFSAQEMLDGNGYNGYAASFWPPLFPVLIILMYLIVGDWFLAGLIISYLASIWFIYFSFLLVKQLYSQTTGLITILFLSITPIVFLNFIQVDNHMLFSALIVTSLYFFTRFLKFNESENLKTGNIFSTELKPLMLSGIFLALAALTRYTGYVVFTSLILLMFLKWINTAKFNRQKSELEDEIAINNKNEKKIENGTNRKRIIVLIKNYKQLRAYTLKFLVFVIPFFLFQLPYYIYSLIKWGSTVYSLNHLNMAQPYHKFDNDFWWNYSDNYHSYFDVLFAFSFDQHLQQALGVTLQFVKISFYEYLGFHLFLFLFLPHIYQKYRMSILFTLSVVIFFISSHLVFWLSPEYLIFSFVLIYGVLAQIIMNIANFISNRIVSVIQSQAIFSVNVKYKIKFVYIKNLVIFLLIVLLILPSYFASDNIGHNAINQWERGVTDNSDYKQVGTFLMSYANRDEFIVAYTPGYSYYAEMNFLQLDGRRGITLHERLLYSYSEQLTTLYPKKPPSIIELPVPDYLIVDRLMVNRYMIVGEDFEYLLDLSFIPDYLSMIYKTEISVVYLIDKEVLQQYLH
jgi:hypothetical protein